jgi:hypothetical protein
MSNFQSGSNQSNTPCIENCATITTTTTTKINTNLKTTPTAAEAPYTLKKGNSREKLLNLLYNFNDLSSPSPISPEMELLHQVQSNNMYLLNNVQPTFAAGVNDQCTSTSAVMPQDNHMNQVSTSPQIHVNGSMGVVLGASEAKDEHQGQIGVASATANSPEKQTEDSTGTMDNMPKAPPPKRKRGKKSQEKPAKEEGEGSTANKALIGMGFFTQIQDSGLEYDQVQGVTELKKKVIKRKRKKKPDLLKNISMGFFSGQQTEIANNEPVVANEMPKRRIVETSNDKQLSDHLKPLYNWAPVLDEKARYAMEYSLPLVVPTVASSLKFSSYAYVYCFILPVVHTLETMLTTFGPKAPYLHLKFAPINPMFHLCADLILLHPICMAMVIWPDLYGPHAYTLAAILLVLEYIYWAVAYKSLVVQREAEKGAINETKCQ